MNSEIEEKLDEIFNEGKKLQAQIADYYKLVSKFSRIVEFDEHSDSMRANIMNMYESLRNVIGETLNY